MTSYLLSWLAKRSAGADLGSCTQRYPGDRLVREPGGWKVGDAGGLYLRLRGP